jgi:hypothetical protein
MSVEHEAECESIKYESIAESILRVLDRQPEAKVNKRYLPDVLALLCMGKIRIIDDSSDLIIVGRPEKQGEE